ncbi:hypothetical protein CXG81DRAFT_28160 [Caulochytrium protostelioides]|uniref:Uncharacterized protein n=1 Tax=Caulochytrium protostelioides TaxID=1555241 RepID=A0A4P9WZU0_9FUNG|nr:hypothetical protein CXG81DRAFT_28160 [Caulochytrium protostelioides]|eukprot:RKO99054.1 hypothetical protein CXG81DRAFT_28160 [Caulochytrium protostelioides]
MADAAVAAADAAAGPAIHEPLLVTIPASAPAAAAAAAAATTGPSCTASPRSSAGSVSASVSAASSSVGSTSALGVTDRHAARERFGRALEATRGGASAASASASASAAGLAARRSWGSLHLAARKARHREAAVSTGTLVGAAADSDGLALEPPRDPEPDAFVDAVDGAASPAGDWGSLSDAGESASSAARSPAPRLRLSMLVRRPHDRAASIDPVSALPPPRWDDAVVPAVDPLSAASTPRRSLVRLDTSARDSLQTLVAGHGGAGEATAPSPTVPHAAMLSSIAAASNWDARLQELVLAEVARESQPGLGSDGDAASDARSPGVAAALTPWGCASAPGSVRTSPARRTPRLRPRIRTRSSAAAMIDGTLPAAATGLAATGLAATGGPMTAPTAVPPPWAGGGLAGRAAAAAARSSSPLDPAPPAGRHPRTAALAAAAAAAGASPSRPPQAFAVPQRKPTPTLMASQPLGLGLTLGPAAAVPHRAATASPSPSPTSTSTPAAIIHRGAPGAATGVPLSTARPLSSQAGSSWRRPATGNAVSPTLSAGTGPPLAAPSHTPLRRQSHAALLTRKHTSTLASSSAGGPPSPAGGPPTMVLRTRSGKAHLPQSVARHMVLASTAAAAVRRQTLGAGAWNLAAEAAARGETHGIGDATATGAARVDRRVYQYATICGGYDARLREIITEAAGCLPPAVKHGFVPATGAHARRPASASASSAASAAAAAAGGGSGTAASPAASSGSPPTTPLSGRSGHRATAHPRGVPLVARLTPGSAKLRRRAHAASRDWDALLQTEGGNPAASPLSPSGGSAWAGAGDADAGADAGADAAASFACRERRARVHRSYRLSGPALAGSGGSGGSRRHASDASLRVIQERARAFALGVTTAPAAAADAPFALETLLGLTPTDDAPSWLRAPQSPQSPHRYLEQTLASAALMAVAAESPARRVRQDTDASSEPLSSLSSSSAASAAASSSASAAATPVVARRTLTAGPATASPDVEADMVHPADADAPVTAEAMIADAMTTPPRDPVGGSEPLPLSAAMPPPVPAPAPVPPRHALVPDDRRAAGEVDVDSDANADATAHAKQRAAARAGANADSAVELSASDSMLQLDTSPAAVDDLGGAVVGAERRSAPPAAPAMIPLPPASATVASERPRSRLGAAQQELLQSAAAKLRGLELTPAAAAVARAVDAVSAVAAAAVHATAGAVPGHHHHHHIDNHELDHEGERLQGRSRTASRRASSGALSPMMVHHVEGITAAFS